MKPCEICRAREDLDRAIIHGDKRLIWIAKIRLKEIINRPVIDLRPLPPEEPHPCPPESLYGDDVIVERVTFQARHPL